MTQPVLHLNLKRKWYDMIESGEKLEEYREIKPHWQKVFEPPYSIIIRGKSYCPVHQVVIEFRNGYSPDARKMIFTCAGIKIGKPNKQWTDVPGKKYFIIKIGKRIS